MFYAFSRFLIRLALPVFLKRLLVFNRQHVPHNVPVMIASNHSGSFFDAIVIGARLKTVIHTLTRGDVFKKPSAAFWLRQINLIPVFRGSEGRQHVKNLDVTTSESLAALHKGDYVVVFSEGICVHEWKLRPLGKGTARMAYQTWFGENKLDDMRVLPTGVNYEHFRGMGKRVSINYGQPIHHTDIKANPAEYEKWLREFTELLYVRMNSQILTIPETATKQERAVAFDSFFGKDSIPAKGNFVLRGLGWVGRAIHRPLYHFFTKKIGKMTGRSVFYDSALFGALVYLYPVIVLLISLIVGAFAGFKTALAVFIALPLLAWIGNRYR